MEGNKHDPHSCKKCKWLYFNESEDQFDCGLGYLGKLVEDDLEKENDCHDFEYDFLTQKETK